MSNYEARLRSNYFAIKDEAAFREFCERYGFTVLEEKARDGRDISVYGFWGANDQGIPSGYTDDEDEFIETDFLGELSDLLAEGDVAILMETGRVKMARLSAQAVAINSRGEKRRVDLEEIYEKAGELGERRTRCEE